MEINYKKWFILAILWAVSAETDGEYLCDHASSINRAAELMLHRAARDQASWFMDVKVPLFLRGHGSLKSVRAELEPQFRAICADQEAAFIFGWTREDCTSDLVSQVLDCVSNRCPAPLSPQAMNSYATASGKNDAFGAIEDEVETLVLLAALSAEVCACLLMKLERIAHTSFRRKISNQLAPPQQKDARRCADIPSYSWGR